MYVPDDVLASLTRPVFGHLFGVRHHAIASIEKATSLLGFRPRYDFVDGHVETYAWFREQGWGGPQLRPQRPGLGRQLGLRRRGRGRGDTG